MSRFEKIDGVGDPIENSKKRQKDNISKTRLLWESNKKKFKEKIWPVWEIIINFTLNQKIGGTMSKKDGIIKDRLKSEKFWEGLAAVAGSVGIYINPEAWIEIGAAAVCLFGAIRAVSSNWGKLFEKDE